MDDLLFGTQSRPGTVLAGRPNLAARPSLCDCHGLAARPCNEVVEMVDHERALGRPASRAALLNEIMADPTWQPNFVFYMGYPKLPAHAVPFKLYSTDQPDAAGVPCSSSGANTLPLIEVDRRTLRCRAPKRSQSCSKKYVDLDR